MGERSFQTYEAWKRACKEINPSVQFEGDKDICQAKPGIGEWDGATGVIYGGTEDGALSDLFKGVIDPLLEPTEKAAAGDTKDEDPGNMILAHKYRVNLKEGVSKIIVFAGDDGGVFYKYKLPSQYHDTYRARWDEIKSVESLMSK